MKTFVYNQTQYFNAVCKNMYLHRILVLYVEIFAFVDDAVLTGSSNFIHIHPVIVIVIYSHSINPG